MTNAFAEEFKKAQELRKAIKEAETEEDKKAAQNELLPVKRTIKKYKISLVDRFVCRPFLCG